MSGSRPWWRRPRVVAAVLVVDLVGGWVLVRLASSQQDSPARAVERLAGLAAHGDWAGVHSHLCRADQQAYPLDELESAGRAALLALRGLDHAEVSSVTPVSVPVSLPLVGDVGLPARQVRGRLIAELGPPADFTVVTIRELPGWRVCLSAGGYALPAEGISDPLGGDGAAAPAGG